MPQVGLARGLGKSVIRLKQIYICECPVWVCKLKLLIRMLDSVAAAIRQVAVSGNVQTY